MGGAHEPTSGPAALIFMGTAALRGLLVVLAVVLGVFVLVKGFPSGAGPAPTAPTSPTEEPVTPQDTGQETMSPEEPEDPARTPVVIGVTVEVLNGTLTTGLAGSTAEQLDALGYDVVTVGDASQRYETTTLFWRRDRGAQSRVEADHLRDTMFTMAELERAPEGSNPDIQIRIVLGEDYAATQ
ncbi:MAG: LytR C-terminal domain-containing protein [Actinomycetota bacterium]|nr:LytR C-terminal domain-containing protein [Actinomycetota bacterium]